MRDKISYYLKSRIFQTYLYSYVGVLLLSFGLLSLISVGHLAENMRNENIRILENKLYTIVEDMEMQIESMQAMAQEMATLQEFDLDYLKQNKYNELELLKRLKKYQQLFKIYDSYFLKYETYNTVFTSTGETRPFELYWNTEISKGGFEKGEELFNELYVNTREASIFYREKETILLFLPLRNYALSKNGREGVLCFQISRTSLEKRMQQLVQTLDGNMSLYYKDFCLLTEVDEGLSDDSEMIEVISSKGNFRIHFHPDESSLFSWSNVFSLKEMMSFAMIFFLLLIIGFVVACWAHKPMRRITEKYKTSLDKELEADWDSIDRLIESLLQGKEQSVELLKAQYQMFKEQTIQLIVSGGYSDRVQSHLTLLNIKLESAIYGTIKCDFTNQIEQDKNIEWKERIIRYVEDLSGDEMQLYAYWESGNTIYVLAAVAETYQLEEAEELLHALFDTIHLQATVDVTGVFRDLREIYAKAKTPLASPLKTDSDMLIESIVAKEGISDITKQALEYMERNYTDYAMNLDRVAAELQVTPSYLSRMIKQQTGMNYKEYLLNLRLGKAKELLINEDISVAEVCQRSGYGNVSYFITVFQKHTGMSPAKYRNERH